MQNIGARLSELLLTTLFKKAPAHERALLAASKQHGGRPFVLDHGHLRFLYFDEKSVQSVMRIDAPLELLFGYTRAMMAFLLLKPAPRHLLLIGLGGGSLLKFCYHYLPNTRITTIEIDADVIALRKQFCIPDDNERLQIICDDAVHYLEGRRDEFDLIMLDGFDIDGLVGQLHNQDFYAKCYTALGNDGMLICNMWGKQSVLATHLAQLRRQFARRVWWGRSSDSYNLLVFSMKGETEGFPVKDAVNPPFLSPEMGLELQQLNHDLHRLPTDTFGNLAGAAPGSRMSAENEWAALLLDISSLLRNDQHLPKSEADWMADFE